MHFDCDLFHFYCQCNTLFCFVFWFRANNHQQQQQQCNSPSFSNIENCSRNLDMQELDYNPSKKDLTDAKIHHLLAEELKPYKRVSFFFSLLFQLFVHRTPMNNSVAIQVQHCFLSIKSLENFAKSVLPWKQFGWNRTSHSIRHNFKIDLNNELNSVELTKNFCSEFRRNK